MSNPEEAVPVERKTSRSSDEIKISSTDWTCSDAACKHVNAERRTHCKRCNEIRFESSGSKKCSNEIGKSAAAHSRGLFKSNDWQCSKCGNVNWAQRTTCNICNAPKFVESEERTGLGGGYNEREKVEYKDRKDSDDDYDEFGRRKKKIDSRDEAGDSEDGETEEDEKEPDDEEVEEEEDEDDVDLSKYDLSSEINEDSYTGNDKAVEKESRRSRSRSPLKA